MTQPVRAAHLRGLAAAVALLNVALALTGCGDVGGGGSVRPTVYTTITPTVVYTPPPPSSTSATTPPATPPQSYAQAQTHFSGASEDSGAVQGFTSPSGNIYCDIYAGTTVRGCELKSGRIAPPTADYCSSGGGDAKDIGRLVFASTGPVAICNSDSMVKAGVPVLKYGTFTRNGDLSCVSETIGVTCVDAATSKGFFLARAKFFIF